MTSPFSRALGAAILFLLLAGAYWLIANGNSGGGDPTANAKLQVLKRPPQLAGEVQEGTGI